MADSEERPMTLKEISTEEFRASPDRFVREAQNSGPIAVVDGAGSRRMILSSPLADEDAPSP